MTASMVPLQVRAHLASGIAQAAPWGIALDGLLASEMHADRKAARRAAGQPTPSLLEVHDPEDLALPLARCQLDTDAWHWAATCAWPENRAGVPVEVRYWTGRLDHRALEQLTDTMPATVSDRQGRYRARRMPLLTTPCAAVLWRAIGDPDAIAGLVGGITAIGKKRSQGEGHVLRWEVTPQPELDPWAAAHLHPDSALGRPTSPACLGDRLVASGGRGTAGLRPPYMHPARQRHLELPALLDG
jgi:CRISPR type IV-associated protein Csf3